MRALALVCGILIAPSAWASNYALCLLDTLPGAHSESMHAAAVTACTQRFPAQFSDMEQGVGRSLLGVSSGAQCVTQHGPGTDWPASTTLIARACGCLYDLPVQGGERCER